MAESNIDNEKEPEEVQEEQITMTKSELQNMFEQFLENRKVEDKGSNLEYEMSEGLSKLAEAVESLKGGGVAVTSVKTPVPRSRIDREDLLEDPIQFFALALGKAIFDDNVNGQIIHTPYNTPIKFNPLYRWNKGGELKRDKQYITVSWAKIHSKREAEFMRNHSKFGIEFWEKLPEATSLSHQLVDKMAAVSGVVNNMGDIVVMERATSMGIPADNDIPKLRKRLIQEMAQRQLQERPLVNVNAYSADADVNTALSNQGEDLQTNVKSQIAH